MAVKEQERTPATGEQDHVVLSGDEHEGRNTATGLIRLTEEYRAHPNFRLTRAGSGLTPYDIFFPLLHISLSMLFQIHFLVWLEGFYDFFLPRIGFSITFCYHIGFIFVLGLMSSRC